jgi:hypothetical protein
VFCMAWLVGRVAYIEEQQVQTFANRWTWAQSTVISVNQYWNNVDLLCKRLPYLSRQGPSNDSGHCLKNIVFLQLSHITPRDTL